MNNRQTDKTITALYERLSRDDELLGDSNSIIGQKQMLEDYAAQHGFTNCVHYTDFTKLTTPMIYEFVDKIFVHAPDRSTGERVQEVDIYLKFIGKFDLPRPEPTAEELEKLEKDRQRRAYNREKSRRCALRKMQRQEAAAV